jgi:multidrug efflux pump subunit AcrA (membrane-fusion protein)
MSYRAKMLLPVVGMLILFGYVVLSLNDLPGYSLGKAGQPSDQNETKSELPITVAVAKASREDLSQQLTLAAEFRPYREIDLHAKVAGYLKDIRVEVGDSVRQGQVIAALEIPEFNSDLNQASAARKRSESEVVRARSEIQRAQSVLDATKLVYSRLAAVSESRPKLLAQQEVDDALAKMRVAEAQFDTAKAGLAVAEEQVRMQEATEARARTMADYTVIAAPFSGLITKRYADKGAMIQAGTASQTQAMPVVRLSQVDRPRRQSWARRENQSPGARSNFRWPRRAFHR